MLLDRWTPETLEVGEFIIMDMLSAICLEVS